MRYKGRELKGPREVVVPILRSEEQGGNIYIRIQGVVDMTPFFSMCPQPEPPQDILPGNRTRVNFDSPLYRSQLNEWWKKKTNWTSLESLKPSELEWETVKMDDPSTWENWMKEMSDSGFVDAEITRIIRGIQEVNGLNEALIEEARQSFLRGEAGQQNGQNSRQAEQKITPSGELAKPSA